MNKQDKRIAELEAEGLTTSDAQGVVMLELQAPKFTLLGSAPSLDELQPLVSRFFGGATISFVKGGNGKWSVYNANGYIKGVRVRTLRKRFRFERQEAI